MKTVNVLWTGGLDSTYRVLELSRTDVTIQPYYLAYVNPSTKYEIRAIRQITKVILSVHLSPLKYSHLGESLKGSFRCVKLNRKRYDLKSNSEGK